MPVNARERAPLKLSYLIETPGGSTHRWGSDEPSSENVPSGEKFGDGLPGGFDAFEASLPRKPNLTYQDLEPLSTIYVKGAGGEAAGEYRLERTPRESGTDRSVNAQGVGWQAHLEDDKTAQEIYVDQDLSHWGDPSVARRIALVTGNSTPESPKAEADTATGQPSLVTEVTSPWATTSLPISEALYEVGVPIGSVYYAWKRGPNITAGPDAWDWRVNVGTDDTFASQDTTGDLQATGPGTGTLTATTATRKCAAAWLYYSSGNNTADNFAYNIFWTRLAVYGTHGLTKQGTASATAAQGFFASDVIANAVSRWAPLLNYTTGANGTVKPTAFVIPQLAFTEPTTAAEIVKEANRFHLRDWAVWDNKTFHYNERGEGGREWRARVGPSQLEETGPAVDRIWNGVIVTYRDVDGTSKTVGPTGSTASATSSDLIDTDPENPANKLGIRRYTLLDMGEVSTAAAATEVGRRFLVESRQLDSSGKAQLVGHVEDSKGTLRPYWQVRSGDTIRFVDAADTSPRRIVKTEKDVGARTCSIDLDAPPEGLDALLERLGVVLVGLGL